VERKNKDLLPWKGIKPSRIKINLIKKERRRIMAKKDPLPKGAYRFVAVLTWPKENPDPEDQDHQDKKAKSKLVELLGVDKPPEVLNTYTFNLSGERTFLITGYTESPQKLYKFIKKITPANISVKFAPRKNPTEKDQVLSVGAPFKGDMSPEPGGHRFVAKLYWDPRDDADARSRITDIVTKVQNQDPQIPGINKVMQCDILVGEQIAWIVGFAYETPPPTPSDLFYSGPDNLQRFISRIVYKQMIDARVSHATSGPVVNKILDNIPSKK
jgi:hypothetical protein